MECVREAATHVLEHGADGEARRQRGGEVFERVDHQVDPAEDKQGEKTQSYRSSVVSAAARQKEATSAAREISKSAALERLEDEDGLAPAVDT